LLSKSKISVGFNLIFLTPQQISNLKSTPNIDAFKNIDIAYTKAMLPQMKTRMVEAAACKTLMLIYKDDWNVIEEWFEPNKHFLYWETFEELENLISEVSTNYEKYWPIVEAANEHVQQYSIDKLMNKIK
jgi:spore maturation protein CgeB